MTSISKQSADVLAAGFLFQFSSSFGYAVQLCTLLQGHPNKQQWHKRQDEVAGPNSFNKVPLLSLSERTDECQMAKNGVLSTMVIYSGCLLFVGRPVVQVDGGACNGDPTWAKRITCKGIGAVPGPQNGETLLGQCFGLAVLTVRIVPGAVAVIVLASCIDRSNNCGRSWPGVIRGNGIDYRVGFVSSRRFTESPVLARSYISLDSKLFSCELGRMKERKRCNWGTVFFDRKRTTENSKRGQRAEKGKGHRLENAFGVIRHFISRRAIAGGASPPMGYVEFNWELREPGKTGSLS